MKVSPTYRYTIKALRFASILGVVVMAHPLADENSGRYLLTMLFLIFVSAFSAVDSNLTLIHEVLNAKPEDPKDRS